MINHLFCSSTGLINACHNQQRPESMQHHTLSVSRTAHYYSLGEPGPHIRRVVIACHGYGQLARFFLPKLEPIADAHTLVIAPEGLSRFYWNGFSGRVVASWMTKEHRLDEIADYAAYLSRLWAQWKPRVSPKTKLILFGFSQGCATVMRWVHREQPDAAHLVFWAGSIPEDLDYGPLQSYFGHRRLHLAFGDADPFLTADTLTAYRRQTRQAGLPVEEFPFSGAHEIPPSALKSFWQERLP